MRTKRISDYEKRDFFIRRTINYLSNAVDTFIVPIPASGRVCVIPTRPLSRVGRLIIIIH